MLFIKNNVIDDVIHLLNNTNILIKVVVSM